MIRKLCLGNLWFSGQRFLEFTYGSNFNHFFLFVSIYESFQILTKLLQTFHNWVNQSRLTKKDSFDWPRHTLLLLQSLHDFSYIAIMSFLCTVFVDLGTRHTESESLGILHTSLYQSIVMKKLCLGNLWFSGEWYLEFTYGSNFNRFLLFVSIYQSLQILTKSLETFHKWPNQSHLRKKRSLN